MKYGQFIATVRDMGEYQDREETERVTKAVLRVLGSRMTPQSADHLAAQLPPPLDQAVRDGADGRPDPFGIEEFYRRVGEATNGHRETAEWDAGAVLTTVARTVSGGELNQVLSQLPSGYAPLFGKNELSD
ncbi:hypothetical protein Acsp03_05360 [Actinomadura sp. NBRC 104412]|uniref:DUF2267 domain-containing protein n=1 Tax=Actinomadura sp. NBRC 104412 TaxID=3032203 RepID=UPI0024A49C35|nr:DUF2267 domain-containing protein [Actinomadura sp. NBRC 104412]GLZ03069.1 hypothetical protein Acsp03_05360 [Actinomadura sp. NBRC 104412]